MGGELSSATEEYPVCEGDESEEFVCSLPGRTIQEAGEFLDDMFYGGVASGVRLNQLGVVVPSVRMEYEREVNKLVEEIKRKKAAGRPIKEIAEWLVERRREIAKNLQGKTGVASKALFVLRDRAKYGPGGKTYENISKRYYRQGYRGAAIDHKIVDSMPNQKVSGAAMKGANFLKNGGRVVIVVSVGVTAYRFLTAAPEDLERVIYEELGGMAGGFLGSGAGVGVCLVFGIASGGWGLLACGAVGGLGGGFLGSRIGNEIYYGKEGLEDWANQKGVIENRMLQRFVPNYPKPQTVNKNRRPLDW